MTISTTLGILLTSILFASLPIAHVALKNHPKVLGALSKVLFAAYLGLLFTMTLGKVSIAEQVSVNFATNGQWLAKDFNWAIMAPNTTDFAINIAMVFPLGYASTFIGKHNSKFSLAKGLATGLAVGMAVETLQFVLPIDRCPSLSDILLNSLSGGIGAGTSILTAKFCNLLDRPKLLRDRAKTAKLQEEQLAEQKSFEIVDVYAKEVNSEAIQQLEDKSQQKPKTAKTMPKAPKAPLALSEQIAEKPESDVEFT